MTENKNPEKESVFEELESDMYKESASDGLRFANYLIDTVVILVITMILAIIFGLIIFIADPDFINYIKNDNHSTLIDYVIRFLMAVIYYTAFEYFTGGRSIGKYITKTKVITIDGKKPSINDCLIRSLCRFIPFEPFSFFGQTDHGWHDSIAKTRVVKI